MMPQIIRRAVLAAVLTALPLSLGAQTTYTSLATFQSAVGTSATDNFDNFTLGAVTGPVARTASPFAYTVQALAAPLDNLYGLQNPGNATDRWLSAEEGSASITFSGFTGGVSAIGGRFFATGLDGNVSGTAIRVRAVDVLGNSIDLGLTPLTSDAFFGVRFDNALVSLTLSANNDAFGGAAYFATANNLTLGGQVVPEPATVWLLAAGMGAMVLVVRQRTRRV
jgi:hypothetical protein